MSSEAHKRIKYERARTMSDALAIAIQCESYTALKAAQRSVRAVQVEGQSKPPLHFALPLPGLCLPAPFLPCLAHPTFLGLEAGPGVAGLCFFPPGLLEPDLAFEPELERSHSR